MRKKKRKDRIAFEEYTELLINEKTVHPKEIYLFVKGKSRPIDSISVENLQNWCNGFKSNEPGLSNIALWFARNQDDPFLKILVVEKVADLLYRDAIQNLEKDGCMLIN